MSYQLVSDAISTSTLNRVYNGQITPLFNIQAIVFFSIKTQNNLLYTLFYYNTTVKKYQLNIF
jgi:hypothetical protein